MQTIALFLSTDLGLTLTIFALAFGIYGLVLLFHAAVDTLMQLLEDRRK